MEDNHSFIFSYYVNMYSNIMKKSNLWKEVA